MLIGYVRVSKSDGTQTLEPQGTPRLTDTDLEEIRRRRRDRNRLGLRQWIVVFLTVCAGDQAGVAAHAWIIPVVGALISFLGVPAGLIGNELSIRYGLRTIATLVFLLSALAGGLLGFTAMLPYITVLGLSVIAGFIVQGNFSNLTSGSSQSPLPSTGGRRSGCIPASALAPHSSARSCSASRSISSAGYRSWPRGSSASAPADSLA
jgi:hypothetical protein